MDVGQLSSEWCHTGWLPHLSGSIAGGLRRSTNLKYLFVAATKMDLTIDELPWGPSLLNTALINSGVRGTIPNGVFENATGLETLIITKEIAITKGVRD